MANRRITVEAAYSKNKETSSMRMHPKLAEVLERLRAEAKKDKGEDPFDERFLFPGPNEGHQKCIRNGFNLACDRAGIKGATPRTLRHTFASRLAMGGHGELTIEKLGRWKDSKMVRRYAHLSQGHLDEAIETLGTGPDSTTLSRNPQIPAISKAS